MSLGVSVLEFQKALSVWGYLPASAVDGVWGPVTANAADAFADEHGPGWVCGPTGSGTESCIVAGEPFEFYPDESRRSVGVPDAVVPDIRVAARAYRTPWFQRRESPVVAPSPTPSLPPTTSQGRSPWVSRGIGVGVGAAVGALLGFVLSR